MTTLTNETSLGNLRDVIRIEEEKVEAHLGELVRHSVEQTLNQLLQAEADELRR